MEYKQNIVIDLEFNKAPAGGMVSDLSHEIIEIGAVRTDAEGNRIDSFQCHVKPTLYPALDPMIRGMTGIRQDDLDGAVALEEALCLLSDWIDCSDGSRFVAWSGNDRRQIELECKQKGIDCDRLPSRRLDLQRVLPRLIAMPKHRRKLSLSKMIDWCMIERNGQFHNALSDASYTAELFKIAASNEIDEYREAWDRYMPSRSSECSVTRLSSNPMASALAGLYGQMAG